jgi:hypothetical protein
MNTEQLIRSLGRDVPPVPRHAVGRRISIGVAAGTFVTSLLTLAWFGLRPDFVRAARHLPFWTKLAYTSSQSLIAMTATSRLARPTMASLRLLWLPFVPVMLLALLAATELAATPARDWLHLWLGGSWKACPWRVLALAVPIFAGLLWSFRIFAPARLRAAGAVAGFAAGSWAATLYALRCGETSALFVLTWYSLGILLATLAGAAMGPRLLRW